MGFLDDAIKFARKRCGNITLKELDTAEFKSDCMPQVVTEFSSLFPQRGEHSLPLIQDQALYDLPDPLILEIVDTSSPSGGGSAIDGLVGSGFTAGSIGGVQLYSSPAIAAVAAEQNCVDDSYSVHVIGSKIEVYPTPTGADTLHMRTHDMWDLGDEPAPYDAIPKRLQSPFRLLVGAHMASVVATRRSKVAFIEIKETKADLRSGIKRLREIEQELRDQLEMTSAVIAGIFAQG